MQIEDQTGCDEKTEMEMSRRNIMPGIFLPYHHDRGGQMARQRATTGQ